MQVLSMKKPGQCCVEWVNSENDRRLKEAAIAALAALKGGRTHTIAPIINTHLCAYTI